MKQQLQLIIGLFCILMMVGAGAHAQLPANYTFPGAPIKPISSYSALDEGGYGNAETDPEGQVQAVFCYNGTISLDATQSDGGATYASYKWFLLDKEGNESTNPVRIGNGTDGQKFDYEHKRTGYHRFRVYGYNGEDGEGCFEITDIAVYVFPPIDIDENYTSEEDEFCENEVGKLDFYHKGGLILDVADFNIDSREAFNNDEFLLQYEWYIIKDGTRYTLKSGADSTYTVGDNSNNIDLSYVLGEIVAGTYQYGVRAYYVFEGGEICETLDTPMFDLVISVAPSKPSIIIGGAAKSRQ